MYRKNKFILILIAVFVLAGCSPITVSAKVKTGFYVGGESNVRRVAIKKITKKFVYFDMAYSGMQECSAKNIKANLKQGGKFTYKDDWGSTGSGIIKISSKCVKIKVKGDGCLSTNNGWKKLKYVSSTTNVWTVY